MILIFKYSQLFVTNLSIKGLSLPLSLDNIKIIDQRHETIRNVPQDKK